LAASTGVNSILVQEGGTTLFTLSQNENRNDVLSSGYCNVLRSGFNHSLSTAGWSLGSHTIYFIADNAVGGCPGDWEVENSNTPIVITITNNPPVNVSLTPNSGDICRDHYGPEVDFTAVYRDTDLQSAVPGRDHDVRIGQVRFGEASDPLALITYTDNESGSNTISFAYGNNISMESSSVSAVDGGNLSLSFTLDFSAFSIEDYGNYNLYLRSTDWAGATDGWDLMGDLDIWNCDQVLIDGTVYDLTLIFPYTTCADLDPAVAPPMASVTVDFDCGADGAFTETTDSSGSYSTTLPYESNCQYALTYPGYFNDLADLTGCGGSCEEGLTGLVQVEPSSEPFYQAAIDFGMSGAGSPWIQVFGGDVVAYSSINNPIPVTCTNDFDGGGSCLPFIASSEPSSGFFEEGVVSAGSAISYGDGLAVGNPNDWQVLSDNLWRPVGRGYNYILSLASTDVAPGDIFSSGQDLADINGLDDGIVAGGETEIKLINGNLIIDRDLEIQPDGAALIVVSGDIIINRDVVRVEGVFIADGSIQAAGDPNLSELQLVMEGTYIADADGNGAGSIINNRDLGPGATGNSLNPAIIFRFRPDLLVSILKDGRITESLTDWQEVRP